MGLAAKKIKPGNAPLIQRSTPFFTQQKDNDSAKDTFFQAKLTVNHPGDRYEQEADAVADHVTQAETHTATLGHNPEPTISTAFFGNPSIHRSFFPGEISDNRSSQNSVKRKLDTHQSSVPLILSPNTELSSDKSDDKLQRESGDDQSFSESEPSKVFENKLGTSKGGGSPLPNDTRKEMESSIGADFGQVNVHTGANAVQMSSEIGAKAFTHKNDIYFNRNQYQPQTSEGKHLLAHELTHTVQQGASIQKKPKNIRQTQPKVQRSILDSIGSFFGSIRDRVVNFVQNIPGFFLFTVLLGRNPLTDEQVDRNGRNIIKGLLLLLPRGQDRYHSLEREGALDRSASWIDQQISTINSIHQQASATFDRAVESLSIGDVARPRAALDRIRGYFNPVVNRATRFARSVGRQVLQFLKDSVLTRLVEFIRTRTRAYPLLRVLLGRDPVTNEEVPRSMENVIHAFLTLTESGEAMFNKMKESGALQRATTWMREQLAILPSATEVIGAFTRAWQSIRFSDLFQPVAAFQRIYGILSDPLGRILRFVGNVAIQILIFIKDAMLGWLRSNANSIPGYSLLTVIIGRDIFTNEQVERNATNLIRGFMGLIPGGERQFQEMQESGVIPRLATRIESAIETLGINWDFIRNLFVSIWRSMTIVDLLVPLAAFARIIIRFREPIGRLFAFISVIIATIVEVILRMMNFPFGLLSQLMSNTMLAIEDVKRDPIGFIKNLLRAVKLGFQMFYSNIGRHLLNGLTGWLFGELQGAGIQPPADLSLRSILGLAMQILGITVDNILNRLARKIGRRRVDRIRSMLNRLTGIWEFVRDVMERGPAAIWEKIQSQISNLWDTIISGIRNWIMQRVITTVMTRIISSLDPTGIMLVVNSCITFFRLMQSVIEHLPRILEILNSIAVGVRQIARGAIRPGAQLLEQAMGRSMPVIIAILANQVGLRGLGRTISQMIGRARQTINQAIDWLLDRAIRLGRGILNLARRAGGAVRRGVGAVLSWLGIRKRLRTRDGHNHRIFFRRSGSNIRLMIASDPKTYVQYINGLKTNHNIPDNDPTFDSAEEKAREIDAKIAEFKLIREPTQAQQRTQNTILSGLVDQLANLTANLPLSSTTGENSNPVFGPLRNGYGTFARVASQVKTRNDGNRPSVRNTELFNRINKRKHDEGSFYIKGHLLNDNLGGKGTLWSNLTPLSRKGNSDHESQFETYPKVAVNDTNGGDFTPGTQLGSMTNFEVRANYVSRSRAVITNLLNPNTPRPTDLHNDEDPNTIADILDAEQYVPATLSCSVSYTNKNNRPGSKSKNVVNDIKYGQLRYYRTREVPRVPLNLNTANLSEIWALPYLHRHFGRLIFDKVREKRPNKYRHYTDISRDTGVPVSVLRGLRKRRFIVLE